MKLSLTNVTSDNNQWHSQGGADCSGWQSGQAAKMGAIWRHQASRDFWGRQIAVGYTGC